MTVSLLAALLLIAQPAPEEATEEPVAVEAEAEMQVEAAPPEAAPKTIPTNWAPMSGSMTIGTIIDFGLRAPSLASVRRAACSPRPAIPVAGTR